MSSEELLLLNQKLEAAHKRLDLILESLDVLGKLVHVQGERIDKIEEHLNPPYPQKSIDPSYP